MSWDELYSDDFWSRYAQRPPLRITMQWIDALRHSGIRTVYDMGCGFGRHTIRMAEQGLSVVASDVSKRALEATVQNLTARDLKANVVYADMKSIPFPDEHFDAVLSIGVLEHNTRRGMQEAVAEILRVLRPLGRLLASFALRTRWISRDEPGVEMLEDNTLRSYGPEADIHHLVDENEIRNLLADFVIHSIDEQIEEYENCRSVELFVSARKPQGC